jgi:hypothetical protein
LPARSSPTGADFLEFEPAHPVPGAFEVVHDHASARRAASPGAGPADEDRDACGDGPPKLRQAVAGGDAAGRNRDTDADGGRALGARGPDDLGHRGIGPEQLGPQAGNRGQKRDHLQPEAVRFLGERGKEDPRA